MTFLKEISPIFTIGIFIVSFLALMGVVNNIQLRPIYHQINSLDTRMDRLDTRIDKLDTRMDRLDTRMDRLDTRIDRLDTHMDRIEEKLDHLIVNLSKNQQASR